jgi:hypothetical protein
MLTVGASCSATALGKLRAAAAQADLPGTDRRHPNRFAVPESVVPCCQGLKVKPLGRSALRCLQVQSVTFFHTFRLEPVQRRIFKPQKN